MVDKINGKGFGPLGNVSRTGNPGAAKKSAEAGKSDRVAFSSALQQASKAQETQSTARAEKVQALKAQIQNGTYKPDLEKVAASVLPFILKDS